MNNKSMKVGILPQPQLAPGLPRGTERGGIFDTPWIPEVFIDATFPTVPSSSPLIAEVPQKIVAQPVSFSQTTMVPARITGQIRGPAVAGMGAYFVGRPRRLPIPPYSAAATRVKGGGIFG